MREGTSAVVNEADPTDTEPPSAPPPTPAPTPAAASTPDPPAEPPKAAPPRRRRREKAWLLRWLHPDGHEWGANISDYDPVRVEGLRRWLSTVFGPRRRYFRVEVAGWQHVPDAPAMVVSNHSGGTLFLDSWGLLWAWYTHFGTVRPIHPAAHEMLFSNRVTGEFFSSRGVIRADKKLAHRVLTTWKQDLLVMPGGDLDVWRPYKNRFDVQFAGRKGYARLALESNVPVIPVANAGAHETLMVLSDGRRFAEALRLPQIARAHIWPVHLSLPWGLAFGPLPHIPTPAKLRYRFGPAVYPHQVGVTGDGEVTDDQVEAFDALVQGRVQEQLDRLAGR